jgi:cytochrome c biogenesis protein CcdA
VSKQVNIRDVYQAQWWRHISYIINTWHVTVTTAVWQHAFMCVTLITSAAAVLVGALAVRPTLRNRALQLCQHWKARAQAAVLAIQQGDNRRQLALMLTTFVVGIVLPILFLNYWVVRRAHNYIEDYVIRPEHMYRHPLTTILVAQLMVVTWPQHQLQFWCIAEALGIAVVFYIALYTWSLVAQAARVKDADEVNIVEYGCMMLTGIWWQLLVFELECLAVESILSAINLCKKLLTMSTVAVLAAVKHAYNKCRSAACMALQAGVKHALATLSKTDYAYTRDMMTMCRRCDSSIAIAVNTPCGRTFLCWSCAEQYRDEHGVICNSCHENSTLFMLQQQQMCVICQEQISKHDLFHIKQCGHQVLLAHRPTYHRHSNTLISSQSSYTSTMLLL